MRKEVTAFNFDPSIRWLFVMPHPDDELAVACFMRRLLLAGASVHAVWVHSTAVRESESRAVAHEIGFEASQIRFLKYGDGDMVERLDELRADLGAVLEWSQPHRVATCAFEQGHLDHDAVHLVLHSLQVELYEWPMYHGYYRGFMPLNEWASGVGETLNLTAEEKSLKQRWLTKFPSQTIRRNVIAYGWLRRFLLKPVFLDRRELLRRVGDIDYLAPVSDTRRIQRCDNWKKWVDFVEKFDRRTS